MAGALRRKMIKMDTGLTRRVSRVDDQSAVGARFDCHPASQVDGGGHDVAVVVVRVFPDQVNASGSAINSPTFAESCSQSC